MNPEDRLRRLRDEDAWDLEAVPRAGARRPAGAASSGFGRRQAWTTAVVAVAVVAVAGIAIGVSPATGSGAAGSDGPSATPRASTAGSAAPTPTPTFTAEPRPAQPSPVPTASAQPSAAPQRAATHGDLPDIAFVAADRSDVARGDRAVACLHEKGVEYVDLAAPDDQGVRYLEFGGVHNDKRSISLGLQYADGCIAAASH